MASVDTVLAASHPYLACPPRVETMADGLGWLLYAPRMLGGTKAAMGQQRPSWLRSAAGGAVSRLTMVLAGSISQLKWRHSLKASRWSKRR